MVQSYLPGCAHVHARLTRGSMDLQDSASQTSSRQQFYTAHRRESLWFTMGRPSPSKLLLCHGGSGPPSKTWFLGHTQVHTPNDNSISSADRAGLTIVTDQQTDRWIMLFHL